MRTVLSLGSLIALLLAVVPAEAKVVAQGKPAKGYYWQKVEKQNGKIVYMCRASGDGKLHNADSCSKAGARKP